ncbi:MAG: hypothetical protein KAQ96_13465 [Thermoplasmata archaeon]|nr:hypothetical protein [Thermoplasmata archaeon]
MVKEEEEESEGEDRPSRMERLRERMPEAGVSFFGTFVLAMVIGFLLALSGMLSLAMIVFLVAIISILAMLFTPSPSTKARREGREFPRPEEKAQEDVEEAVGTAHPDLIIDGGAAPTAARPGVPAPPPEPPPLEDIVIDVVADEEGEADEAPAEDDDDVWVE